jgi:serine/threonine protein kinase
MVLFDRGISEWLRGYSAAQCLQPLDERVDISTSSVIASGKFGEVRLATDFFNHQQLAIKIVTMEQDVRKEVKVLSEVDHPNIVKLLDVLVHRRQLHDSQRRAPYLCIVMEYIPNSNSIAKYILASGPVITSAVQLIVRQLASALDAMHEQGICHRDVWVENVLLDDFTGHVTLVDFGQAEHFNVGPNSTKFLNIPYMSPESSKKQRQGPGDDSWAVGLLLSELLTGKFIKDRLKCTTISMHSDTARMGELLADVVVRDDTWDMRLSRSCQKLLDYNGTKRLSMLGFYNALSGNLAQLQGNGDLQGVPTVYEIPRDLPPLAPLHSNIASHGSTYQPPLVTAPPIAEARYQPPPAGESAVVVRSWVPAALPTSQLQPTSATTAVISGSGRFPVQAQPVQAYVSGSANKQILVGQRIKYTARSNGVEYHGRVAAQNAKGVTLALDCGETKEVAADNLWRVQSE